MNYERKPSLKIDKGSHSSMSKKISTQMKKSDSKLKTGYDTPSFPASLVNGVNANAIANVITSIRTNYHNVAPANKPRTNSQKPSMADKKKLSDMHPSAKGKQSVMRTDVNEIGKILFGQSNIQALSKQQQEREAIKQKNEANYYHQEDSPGFGFEGEGKAKKMIKRNWGDSASKPNMPIEFTSSIDEKLEEYNKEIQTLHYNNTRASNYSLQLDANKKSINQQPQHFNRQSSEKQLFDIKHLGNANPNPNDSNSFNVDENERKTTEVFTSPPKFLYSISPMNKYSPSKYNNIKYTRTTQKESMNRDKSKNALNSSSNNINKSDYSSSVNALEPKDKASQNTSKKTSQKFPQLIERNITQVQLKLTERPLSSLLNVPITKDKYGNPSRATKYNLMKQPQLNIKSIHNASNSKLHNAHHNKAKSPLRKKDRRPFSQIQKKHTVPDKNTSLNGHCNLYGHLEEDRRLISNTKGRVHRKNSPDMNKASFTNRRLESNVSSSHQSKNSKNYPVITVTNRGNLQINTSAKPMALLSFEPRGSIPIIYTKKTIDPRHPLNSNQSTTSACKQAYISKMAEMDDDKFKKLIQIVDKLDNSNSSAKKGGKANVTNKDKYISPFNEEESPINRKKKDSNIISINYINADTVNLGNINMNYNNYTSKYLISNESSSNTADHKENFRLIMKMISNWGHSSKIGLNCIELFDKDNNCVKIKEVKVFNSNTSVMPITFRGKKMSVRDEDMFICDYTSCLSIEIVSEVTMADVSYMKVWNYNGKDISKGLKEIELYIRNELIYKGLCSKGLNTSKEDYSTLIRLSSSLEHSQEGKSSRRCFYNDTFQCIEEQAYSQSINSARQQSKGNPFYNEDEQEEGLDNEESYEKNMLRTSIARAQTMSHKQSYEGNVIWCNKIRIVLSNNYGHRRYAGLTGLQFFDENKELINIEQASSIGAMPKDIRNYYDDNDDCRIFENVFNGINKTVDDSQMWLTVKKPNEPLPYLEIVFDDVIGLSCIKCWNYNSVKDLDKGVKTIELYFDGGVSDCPYHRTIYLRKGIGKEGIDYSQDITFPYKEYSYTEEELEPFKTTKFASFLYNQCYETPYLPSGVVLKLSLLSAWGSNEEQIGLNHIELYDQLGRALFHKRNKSRGNYKVSTYPPALIDYIDSDEEYINQHSAHNSIESIIEGLPNKSEGWVSSFNKATRENIIFIMFKNPISLSYIKVYNYHKHPNSGVKDIAISFDDQRIFEGQLNKARPGTTGKDKDTRQASNETLILFTCDLDITKHLDEEQLSKPLADCAYHQSTTERYIELTCNQNGEESSQ